MGLPPGTIRPPAGGCLPLREDSEGRRRAQAVHRIDAGAGHARTLVAAEPVVPRAKGVARSAEDVVAQAAAARTGRASTQSDALPVAAGAAIEADPALCPTGVPIAFDESACEVLRTGAQRVLASAERFREANALTGARIRAIAARSTESTTLVIARADAPTGFAIRVADAHVLIPADEVSRVLKSSAVVLVATGRVALRDADRPAIPAAGGARRRAGARRGGASIPRLLCLLPFLFLPPRLGVLARAKPDAQTERRQHRPRPAPAHHPFELHRQAVEAPSVHVRSPIPAAQAARVRRRRTSRRRKTGPLSVPENAIGDGKDCRYDIGSGVKAIGERRRMFRAWPPYDDRCFRRTSPRHWVGCCTRCCNTHGHSCKGCPSARTRTRGVRPRRTDCCSNRRCCRTESRCRRNIPGSDMPLPEAGRRQTLLRLGTRHRCSRTNTLRRRRTPRNS